MIEQFMTWLSQQYEESSKIGNKTYPREKVAFQRGREMAFYTAWKFTLRHADAPESMIRANFHNMHTACIYLDDGQFTNGFNEAALDIKLWLATHHK